MLPQDDAADSDAAADCLQPYFMEKHLWGLGFKRPDMLREAVKLSAYTQQQLCRHATAQDAICVVADARIAQLQKLTKSVLRSARGAVGSTIKLVPRRSTGWWGAEQDSQSVEMLAGGDEDVDGVLHWLGTNGGVDDYRSPVELGRVDVKAKPSKFSRGSLKDIFDSTRKQLNMSADETDDAYLQFELKDIALAPTAYKL
eukprot:SAG31_NODE_9678_length_1243_cov_0.965035_1_plen_199_part_10